MKYIFLFVAILSATPVLAEPSVMSYAPTTEIQQKTQKIFAKVIHTPKHSKYSPGLKVKYSGVSLNGVKEPLKSWTFQTIRSCPGSKVISAYRKTRVKGTGHWSLHASGKAVDITGNPSCVAQRLKSWSGGASNDYWRIRPHHYHVSYGGSEMGLRFAHR